MIHVNRHNRSPLGRRSPLRNFLTTEASGAILLVGGVVVALLWANSPWAKSYEELWSARAGISAGGRSLVLDLRRWINDGLMTVFVLVVGLEIKRELTDGQPLVSTGGATTRHRRARRDAGPGVGVSGDCR